MLKSHITMALSLLTLWACASDPHRQGAAPTFARSVAFELALVDPNTLELRATLRNTSQRTVIVSGDDWFRSILYETVERQGEDTRFGEVRGDGIEQQHPVTIALKPGQSMTRYGRVFGLQPGEYRVRLLECRTDLTAEEIDATDDLKANDCVSTNFVVVTVPGGG